MCSCTKCCVGSQDTEMNKFQSLESWFPVVQWLGAQALEAGLVCALALLLRGCVALSKLLGFSVPYVVHPKKGIIIKPNHRVPVKFL